MYDLILPLSISIVILLTLLADEILNLIAPNHLNILPGLALTASSISVGLFPSRTMNLRPLRSGQFRSVPRGSVDYPFRPMLTLESRVKFQGVIPLSHFNALRDSAMEFHVISPWNHVKFHTFPLFLQFLNPPLLWVRLLLSVCKYTCDYMDQ